MNPKEINLPDGADALECWCQVTPIGVFPGEQDNRAVEQIIDEEGCRRLVEAFSAPVLVDFEHRSVDEAGDTLAAGWAKKLRCSAEAGLEALIEWTDVGAADVRGKRRRYLSGVWRLGADGRPLKLRSIALTNKPNMPNRPVLNRAAKNTESGEPTVGAPQPKENTMKEIAAIYGLPETATAAEIAAAAKADRDKIAALQKQLDELNAARLNTEAEKVAEENEGKIANKEAFKKLYIKNKALAIEFLGCLPKADPKPVCNKADAKLPSFAAEAAKADKGACMNKLAKWRDMPEGAEKDAYLDANADDIAAAMDAKA